MKHRNAITITDIAREAGVSIATVSRVLTGNAPVAAAKKERIEAAIKKYDFHPNALARGLIQTKTNLIGLITADIRNPFYSAMFISCEQAATGYGCNLLLCNSLSDRVKEFELLDQLSRQRVDAIIQIGGAVDDLVTDSEYAEKVNLVSERIPFVITGRLDGTSCTRININETKAMTLVMEHLCAQEGIRTVAFAGGSTQVKATVELRACWRKMMRTLHLEYVADFDEANGRYDDEGGFLAMEHILAAGKPDAVITVNDFTAMGALRSLREHGYAIPADVKLISFDDTYLATLAAPQLTSVSYNYRSYGETIISTTVKLINGEEVPPETFVEPKLIIRGSC